MKDIDSVKRSKKKANVRSLSISSSSADKCNGTSNSSTNDRKVSRLEARRTNNNNNSAKSIMGATNTKTRNREHNHSSNSLPVPRGSPKKRGLKHSPEMRPRRRASQTYFFKYQLARNPLKAEEEDLKLALRASLQQHQDQLSEPAPEQEEDHSSSTDSDSATITSRSVSPEAPVVCPKPTTPENVLTQYRPETEDFLTFICFRATAPNYQKITKLGATNGIADDSSCNNNNNSEKNDSNNNSNTNTNGRQSNNYNSDCCGLKYINNDANNLKQSPMKLAANQRIGSPVINDHLRNQSPNSYRKPTRQSPRLANSIQKKISENDSSSQTTSISNTAYDIPINYEEDLERASIALEGMAHEINSSDGLNNINVTFHNDDDNNNLAQNSPDCNSRLSRSSYKNNRHLVKGLMTREFAGAFADEETIFESISNHKL